MLLRNVLLAIGAVFVLAGVGLLFALYGQIGKNPAPAVFQTSVEAPQALLIAKHKIPAGKPLENEDITPKKVGPGEVPHPGSLQQGQESEFLGMTSVREIGEGQPLIASDFVKPCTKLIPPQGYRAISIFVDPAQIVAGLVVIGDYVDVLLAQTFDDKITTDPRRKWAGETVLHDVQVLATDQTLCAPSSLAATAVSTAGTEARTPKTVTLALKERQAEVLMVAGKLGTFQLALIRHLESADAARLEDKHKAKPVWASDVSPALAEFVKPLPPPLPPECSPRTGSTIETSVRCPPGTLSHEPEAPKTEKPNGMRYAPPN
jgi:pilus assembly protein CpaB